MAVDGVDALHILRHHMAVGVHAEGADAVPVLLGAVDQLGLIDHVGDVLKDLGGQLHPDPDVHLVVDEGDAQPLALPGKPLGAGAARGGDQIGALQALAILQGEPVALPGRVDPGHGGAEPVVDFLPQILIDVGQDLQVVLGAQMLALGLQQVQVVLQGLFLQLAGLRGVGGEALGGGPEVDVHRVHIADQVHDLPGLHVVGEPAPEGGGEVELAVGKGAGAAETAHGVADGAVDAPVHLAGDDGTVAGVDVRPLIQHQHFQFGPEFFELVAGEDTSLAAADDGHIVVVHNPIDSSIVYPALETSKGSWQRSAYQYIVILP